MASDILAQLLLMQYGQPPSGPEELATHRQPILPMASLPSLWERYAPRGSAAMAERGPWMRDKMPASLADFLASALTYAPMALPASRGGAGMGRDAMMAYRLDRNQPMQALGGGEFGPLDPGVAGGPRRSQALSQIDRMFATDTLRKALEPHPANVRTVDPYDLAVTRQQWQRPANQNKSLQIEGYIQAVIDQQWADIVRRSRQPDFRVIPGGKTD